GLLTRRVGNAVWLHAEVLGAPSKNRGVKRKGDQQLDQAEYDQRATPADVVNQNARQRDEDRGGQAPEQREDGQRRAAAAPEPVRDHRERDRVQRQRHRQRDDAGPEQVELPWLAHL